MYFWVEMSIRIDKNKSIPVSPKGVEKYPWSKLSIGDSFLVGSRHWAYGSLANYNKKNKKEIKITTRQEGEKCRVWRIK